jgi:hypothetical protein
MVSHEGGVFISRTMPRGAGEVERLRSLNQKLLEALGMVRGVTHAEFILAAEDNRFYFLETAARVGGANIAEMIEASTGVNMWSEWASIELANIRNQDYQLPEHRSDYAGIIICLARQESPDLSQYADPEIVWRMVKKNHAGIVVASEDQNRIETLLDSYSQRFADDFLAFAPPLEKAPD